MKTKSRDDGYTETIHATDRLIKLWPNIISFYFGVPVCLQFKPLTILNVVVRLTRQSLLAHRNRKTLKMVNPPRWLLEERISSSNKCYKLSSNLKRPVLNRPGSIFCFKDCNKPQPLPVLKQFYISIGRVVTKDKPRISSLHF